MSKLSLTGNASGTGTFTIAAPNSNTDRVLTLPDEAGTVLTSASDIPSSQITGSLGITEADSWRITSGATAGSTGVGTDLTANFERADDASFNYIGTGMSQSSGVFTFPSTGIYLVTFSGSFYRVGSHDRATQVLIQVSTDGGSNWDQVGASFGGVGPDTGLTNFGHVQTQAFVDVTSTANVKVKFSFAVFGSTSTTLDAGSSSNNTFMNFIRLGDT